MDERLGTVLASHRFGWSLFELVSMAMVTAVLVLFVIVVPMPMINTFMFIGLGVGGSVLLWNLGRTRKNAVALELREKDGTWLLYTGKSVGTGRDGDIRLADVDEILAKEAPNGEVELILHAPTESGMKSLGLPARLLAANPSLCDTLFPLVDEFATGSTRPLALELVGAQDDLD